MDAIIVQAVEYIPMALDGAFAVVAIASAVAAVTRTPADDEAVAKIYRVLDILALNVGYAKDRPEKLTGGRFVAR